jgi:predicted GIY-YIG superfamily endonuclease
MNNDHYYVYVVLLSNEVLTHKKFKSANPSFDGSSPCIYVGMTGLDPDTRFNKHKAGIKANTYVRLYGERLMPELVADLKQPMSYSDAKYLEVDVAIKLRELGYAVWQA